jgi:hypothetical protein
MFINHLSPTIMANYSHDDTTTIGRWCTFKPGTTTQPPYRTLALKVHGREKNDRRVATLVQTLVPRILLISGDDYDLTPTGSVKLSYLFGRFC